MVKSLCERPGRAKDGQPWPGVRFPSASILKHCRNRARVSDPLCLRWCDAALIMAVMAETNPATRVLIVDDDGDIRDGLVEVFQRAGFIAHSASDVASM